MRVNLIFADRYYKEGLLTKARHHTWMALAENWRALFLREWYERLIRVLLGPRLIGSIKNLVS